MISYTTKEMAVIFMACANQDEFDKAVQTFHWLIRCGFIERSTALQNIALRRLKQLMQ